MSAVIIAVDATIALGARLEAKLADAHFELEYLPLFTQYERWDQIEALLIHSYLPDECLKQMKRCRYIGIRAVNTNYVNVPLAAAMGIRVEGLKKQHGVNSVAEHTIALLFGLTKNLVNADLNAKNGKWREGLRPNVELKGKTLGIIGYGKIGQRVAEIGWAIGMKVLVSGMGHTADEVALDEVLAKSDFISLHLSGTEKNRNFLNKERIEQIKEGAMLINTTRALVVDYEALGNALRSGKLSGLGLDVFPEEPLRHHPICDYENVICTPHTAYITKETLDPLNEEVIDHVMSFFF
jgi:phosphoglycerate dehydrogenase-like enzyme